MKKLTVLLMSLALLSLQAFAKSEHEYPQVTHGVAVGDVTSHKAIIWSRADREGMMNVIAYSKNGRSHYESIFVKAEDDFTGQVKLKDLRPDTQYHYKVWFESKSRKHSAKSKKQAIKGTFRTAPRKHSKSAVKVSWSGDFAGQNVCRDLEEGFPIFNAVNQEDSNLFIGLGDMIYADNLCESVGRYGNKQVEGDFVQASDLPNYWAHWKYNREDQGFQKLLATTPYYGIWDDHEVVNDFGPLVDTRDTPPYTAGQKLLPIGLKSFFDYNPINRAGRTPERMYRNIRWGKHLEMFFLDTRQYRDANLSADQEGRDKTMLGREQLVWLQEKIQASDATWKVIVSSVPMSIPTGFPQDLGRDGWANDDDNTNPTVDGIAQSDTGFEQELVAILKTLRDEKANTLFITTDVHFAEVFRYTPFANDESFKVHEVVIGPGNAGLFPNREFDETLGTESLFFFGPESSGAVTSWKEAKKWFNYGTFEIDGSGQLIIDVKDTYGESQYNLTLAPR